MSKFSNLREFPLTLKQIYAIKKETIQVRFYFHQVPVSLLRKYKPMERMQRIAERKGSDCARVLKALKPKTYRIIGTKQKPLGLTLKLAGRDLKK